MNPSRKSSLVSIFATLFCLATLALPYAASGYDAAGDFSSINNPNGVWSCGWSTTLGGTFNLDTTNTTAFQGLTLNGWMANQGPDAAPYVVKNSTASPVTYVNTTWQPGQLAINPIVGFYGILRWTAPSSGQFNISATFSGMSSIGDSTDVHVLRNGVSIYNAEVTGTPGSQLFSGSQTLGAGDHIDFVVGIGTDGNDHEDVTGLSATIVPEPGTFGLVATALCGLVSFRFLKRK